MKIPRLVTHALRATTRYKLRSAFMFFGSVVGIAALTLVIGVGQAVERKMLRTVRQLFGASSIMVMAGGGRLMASPRGEVARLTLDDIQAVASELPTIEAWDPQQILSEAAVRHGDAHTTARVLGQSERAERVWNRSVTRGESFDAAAVAASARVALIGETAARELFGSEDPLGAEILVGPAAFRVIGILEPFGTDAHGMDRDNEVVVPISTAMRRVLNVDTILAAKLLVRDPSEVEGTAREVARILRERHAVPAGQPDDFTIVTAVQVQQMVRRTQRVLFVFFPLVAGVVLVACAVVGASLMLASVSARVGEIGLRRAVGARPADIRLQFLLEAVVTTISGGVVGIVVAGVVGQLVATRFHLASAFSWQALVIALLLSAATGLGAGVLPANRAARMQPVDALR